MFKEKVENEILASMDRKLSNDDLQDNALKLKTIADKLNYSINLFKQANLNMQAEQLENILLVIGSAVTNNLSFKKIIASINDDLSCQIKGEDLNNLLNSDIGDINLSEDDIQELENELLSEVSFEDELD